MKKYNINIKHGIENICLSMPLAQFLDLSVYQWHKRKLGYPQVKLIFAIFDDIFPT